MNNLLLLFYVIEYESTITRLFHTRYSGGSWNLLLGIFTDESMSKSNGSLKAAVYETWTREGRVRNGMTTLL